MGRLVPTFAWFAKPSALRRRGLNAGCAGWTDGISKGLRTSLVCTVDMFAECLQLPPDYRDSSRHRLRHLHGRVGLRGASNASCHAVRPLFSLLLPRPVDGHKNGMPHVPCDIASHDLTVSAD